MKPTETSRTCSGLGAGFSGWIRFRFGFWVRFGVCRRSPAAETKPKPEPNQNSAAQWGPAKSMDFRFLDSGRGVRGPPGGPPGLSVGLPGASRRPAGPKTNQSEKSVFCFLCFVVFWHPRHDAQLQRDLSETPRNQKELTERWSCLRV